MTKLFQYAGIAASVVLIAFGIGAAVIGLNGPLPRRHRACSRADRRHALLHHPEPARQLRCRGAGLCQGHPQAHARGHRRQDLRTDAAVHQPPPARARATRSAAGKDPKTGAPTSNPARQIWVTETALTTALNTAYFAESMATFVAAIGFALLLIGIGFLVLTLRLLRQPSAESVKRSSGPVAKVAVPASA